MAEKLTRFDGTEYLETPQDHIELLNEALATGDPRVIAGVVGEVARARGMSELARVTGIRRSTLYAALANDANPTMDTIMRVLDALNVELRAQPAAAA